MICSASRVVVDPREGPIRFAAPILVVLIASAGPGCLWLPEFPPDKIDPPTTDDDDDGAPISFCTPRPRSAEPVMVGGPTSVREIRCRVRGAQTITWTLYGVDGTPLDGQEWVIAQGVERVELHRDSLPWSPVPYKVELILSVFSQTQGTAFAPPWPLIVVPDADDLVDPQPWLGPQPGLDEEPT